MDEIIRIIANALHSEDITMDKLHRDPSTEEDELFGLEDSDGNEYFLTIEPRRPSRNG